MGTHSPNECSLAGQADVVSHLLKEGARIDAIPSRGMTALMYAVWNGHRDVVRILLLGSADPNVTVFKDDTVIAQLLVESGASIDAKDDSGLTALLYAACDGHEQMAEFLISHGADVNAHFQAEPQKPTSSPLSCALKRRHQSTAEMLRKTELKVSLKDWLYQ